MSICSRHFVEDPACAACKVTTGGWARCCDHFVNHHDESGCKVCACTVGYQTNPEARRRLANGLPGLLPPRAADA